jgi:uncharacterized protein (DUF736 family)
MSNYDNSYSGTLGKNKKKEPGDKKPDYTGQINIDGVGHWLSGWIRKSQDGESFLSIKAEPKEQQSAPAKRQAPRRDARDDQDSDVPF